METEHRAEENGRTPGIAEEVESFPLPLSGRAAKRTTVWAIAGFDPSSGAGITADLLTIAAHGLFGCSAITALTVQSTRGVFACEPMRADLLRATLDRLADDLPFSGVKVGMLATAEIARELGDFLRPRHRAAARGIVVLDPVLRSSSGRDLFPAEAVNRLHDDLLPVVDWITPNWAELALLAEEPVVHPDAAERAARRLQRHHPQLRVVATGGDQEAPDDLFVDLGGVAHRLTGERVETTSTHGTGCAFSSALMCCLVRGAKPLQAVKRAKAFVEGALRAAPGVGQGRGPMGLLWPLEALPANTETGC